MTEIESTCSNPGLQRDIVFTVGFQLGLGKDLSLSEEMLAHLDTCDSCKEWFPRWVAGARAVHELNEQGKIIEAAGRNDPSVLKRRVGKATALFKSKDDDPQRGIMVLIGDRSPFDVQAVREVTLEVFNSLE
jgi:hypothetical protein